MKLADILKLSLNSLTHRGLRSWLTILGIIIGVAAVIAMLSIGAGMSQNMKTQLSSFGTDVITVSAGRTRAQGPEGGFGDRFQPGGGFSQTTGTTSSTTTTKLTDKDINAILTAQGVDTVSGIITGRASVQYLAQTVTVTVEGINPTAWNSMTTSKLELGRFLEQGDGTSVLIGYNVAHEMFNSNLTENSPIKIGGKTFSVAGILQQSGTGGFGGDDRTIFMTLDTARDIVTGLDSDQYSSLQIKITNTNAVDQIIQNVDQVLYTSRMVTSDTADFTVTSPTAMLQTIQSTMATLTFFLTGIAAISLLVGAIGIANTMFMSVMERTRLIGILKSIGTRNSEIMKLFLTESGIIGLMGGLLGVFLGLIVVGIISSIGINIMGMGRLGTSTSVAIVTPELVLFALLFSTIIGIISGLIPARKAANLQVVEAMRSE
ncbi:MAG TPA: ABC transporter permease [Candidatus Thermoplasmatota archaeon]|nr:ABC transporter permease [Candidatus Thermoplasmatota archaeon]